MEHDNEDYQTDRRAALPATLARHDDIRDIFPLAEHLVTGVTWCA